MVLTSFESIHYIEIHSLAIYVFVWFAPLLRALKSVIDSVRKCDSSRWNSSRIDVDKLETFYLEKHNVNFQQTATIRYAHSTFPTIRKPPALASCDEYKQQQSPCSFVYLARLTPLQKKQRWPNPHTVNENMNRWVQGTAGYKERHLWTRLLFVWKAIKWWRRLQRVDLESKLDK